MRESELKGRLTDFEKPVGEDKGKDKFGGTLDKDIKCVDDNTKAFKKRKVLDKSMMKTPKDSQFFAELFRSLKKGNSSYVTYLNELVDGSKGDVYIPQYVYCFLKNRRLKENNGVYGEVVAPRLADLLGVKTAFNTAIEKDPYEDYDDDIEYSKILSVDFVPYGYTFMDLQECGLDFDADSTLEMCDYWLNGTLRKVAKKNEVQFSAEDIKGVKEEFVRQYLFRSLLCEDLDFSSKNCGLLLGENGSVKMSPMFDFELVFKGQRAKSYYDMCANTTILYCKKRYPHILNEFMSKLEENSKNNKINKVLENTMEINYHIYANAKAVISRNIDTLLNTYHSLCPQEHTM